MRKGKSLIGLKIVAQLEGLELGVVKDLVFDHEKNQLAALLLSERDLFGLIDAQIVPWEFVRNVGTDAIMVEGAQAKMKVGANPQVHQILQRENSLSGARVYTSDGKFLGTFADMVIDVATGAITGYEVSGGLVSDTLHGKSFLPAPAEMSLGQNVAIIPPSAADQLVPGKQNPVTPDPQAGSGITPDDTTPAPPMAQRVNDTLERGTAALQDVAANAARQTEPVKEQLGEAWQSMKQKMTALAGSVQEKAASLTGPDQARVDRVLGRPTTRVVLDRNDVVILKAGDLVTNAAVERARAGGVLELLLDSVDVGNAA